MVQRGCSEAEQDVAAVVTVADLNERQLRQLRRVARNDGSDWSKGWTLGDARTNAALERRGLVERRPIDDVPIIVRITPEGARVAFE